MASDFFGAKVRAMTYGGFSMYRLFIFLALLIFLAGSAVAADRVVLIGSGVPDAKDVILIEHIEALGFTVELHAHDERQPVDLTGVTLVFISDSISSGNIGDAYLDSTVPVVNCEAWTYDDMGFTADDSGLDNAGGESLTIVDTGHPITRGLPEQIQVYDPAGPIANANNFVGDVDIVAVRADDESRAAITVYEAGAQTDSRPTQARHINLFSSADGWVSLTDDGWELVERSILYAVDQLTKPPGEKPGVPSGSYAATWGAAKNSTSVYIQEHQVDIDTIFDVDVRIGRARNLAGFQLSFSYDPHNLTFMEAQEGTMLSRDGGASFWRHPDINTEEGIIAGATSTRTEAGGLHAEDDVLLTLTFQARELGSSMIALQDVKLSDPEGELLPYIVTNAFITISPPWDVVPDSIIDIRDMVIVGQNLADPQLSVLFAPQGDMELVADTGIYNPDVDRNGIVDVDDLILVNDHFGEVYQESSVAQQTPVAELRRLYARISTAPNGSPDIKRLKAHLSRLLASHRAISRPTSPRLLPNYPNPFNPDTWIPYHLTQAGDVAISIYNASGQLVRTLNLGHREAGFHTNKGKSAHWDGRNDNGEQLASGLYFYVMRAGHFTAARKMLLVK